MNMTQRAGRIMKQWAIFGGLFVGLHILFFLGWAVINPRDSRSTGLIALLVVLYLIGLIVIGIFFFRRVEQAATTPEFDEARREGLPALAKVLDIKKTGWRRKRLHTLPRLTLRPRINEYEM